MLPVKVKMRCFNYTNLCVYRNLSRHTTWHQRSYQIAFKKGNQNPQNKMIASFSFASTAHVTQWSNYPTQWAEILTQRSNLTARVKRDLSVVSVVPKSLLTYMYSKLASQFPLFFFPRQVSCSQQFTPNGSILANTSLLLNTLRKNMISWSRTWSISWHVHSRIGKIAHIIEQPNT